METPRVLEEPLFTLDQVAQAIPNRRGDGHVHRQTILRRVKRGEFPAPDVAFGDGTRLWKQSTLRRAMSSSEATAKGAA